MEINISSAKKIHFVGIKGIAMASLAVYAKERGCTVSGTDTDELFPSDEILAQQNIVPVQGFHSAHITTIKPDLVIYTGAHHGRENPEVQEAEKCGIPVLPHGKALGLFMTGKRQISVAGSHGKTTTSAMIASILIHAGWDPSYTIGSGYVAGLGTPGHYGKSDWFVAEADEYVTDPGHDRTPRFLWQNPEILVITNIEYDHPDAYDSLDDVVGAFMRFTNNVVDGGNVILSSDNVICSATKWHNHTVVVGHNGPDYKVKNIHFNEGKTYFELETKTGATNEFVLQVPGKHNAQNAALAAVAAHSIGLSWYEIRKGLRVFGGAKRRFELIGNIGTTLFYDDYAHHPSEIEATLSAARAWYPSRRIIAVFQPHTYSRTKALLREFASSFVEADIVITTEIYASAREMKTLGISGDVLADKVAHSHSHSFFAYDSKRVEMILDTEMKNDDVVIFMGAGDIWNWGKKIVMKLMKD